MHSLKVSYTINFDLFVMWPLALFFAAYSLISDGPKVFFFAACVYVLRIVPAVGLWMSYSKVSRIFYAEA
jgi:hypothetical protein